MDVFDTFAFGSVFSSVVIVLFALISAALESHRNKLKTDNAHEKSAGITECPYPEVPECPLKVLGTMPVEQWWLWAYWFIRALSECAPRKEYEHFLRDLERLISFRLNNGSWEPDQDSE